MDGTEAYPTSLAHVLAELTRLDVLLRIQIARRRAAAPDELAGGLARLERLDTEIAARVETSLREHGFLRLPTLARVFDLAPIDVDIVVICLAAELDRRYGRLYAHLQADPARRAPTVDLVLNLLCPDVEARVAHGRARFSSSAPLLRHHLVTIEDDPTQCSYSLLDKNIRLSARVAGFLLEDDQPDTRLAPYVRIVLPAIGFVELCFPAELGARLSRLAAQPASDLVLYCQGGYGVGKQAAAEACCQVWGAVLLVVHGARLAGAPAEEFTELLGLIAREARLQGAILFWADFDLLLAGDQQPKLAELLAAVAAYPAPAFLAGDTVWEPAGIAEGMAVLRLEFPPPGHDDRVRLWRAALGAHDIPAPDLDSLATKFRLSGGQIRDAAATAQAIARTREPSAPAVTEADLHTASRLQSNQKLAALAQRITPCYGWADIVLPADRMAQLREIHDQVRYRSTVYETWGFHRTLARGRGLSALFAGPSGTGKTMAADVLANVLGLDLYKIDLSTVVSKYIGETEKNLGQIFTEAATSNAILFFDEADALFSKRTQVRDAHDRHANVETSYLLQKLEEHEGVVILATNLRKNLDEAFVRRISCTIDFPVPGVEERRRIWTRILPAETPHDPDVDLEVLATQLDVPGGSIRNIAVAAAFLAAADGGVITMAHLVNAASREYQKMGKVRAVEDFGQR